MEELSVRKSQAYAFLVRLRFLDNQEYIRTEGLHGLEGLYYHTITLSFDPKIQ
jgi:hypothetical protein